MGTLHADQPGIGRVYGLGVSMGAGLLLQALRETPELQGVVSRLFVSTFHDVAAIVLADSGAAAGRHSILSGRLKYGIDLRLASPEKQRSAPATFLCSSFMGRRTATFRSAVAALADASDSTVLWEVPARTHSRIGHRAR